MFFPDKLVCFRKYKNKQAWLMTRLEKVKIRVGSLWFAWHLLWHRKWLGCKKSSEEWQGNQFAKTTTMAMTTWRQKKMGRSPISYSYGALLGDEAISIPQRRKYCNFPIFLLSNSTCPSWWILSESQRVFHHHMYKISVNFIIPINTNFVMVFVLGKYCNIKLVCVWSLTRCTEDSYCPQYSNTLLIFTRLFGPTSRSLLEYADEEI